MAPIVFKVKLGDDLRRFSVERDAVAFVDVVERLRFLYFGGDAGAAFKLAYADEDGDRVVVSSQEELMEALAQLTPAAPLRLFVERTATAAAAPAAGPAASASAGQAAPATPQSQQQQQQQPRAAVFPASPTWTRAQEQPPTQAPEQPLDDDVSLIIFVYNATEGRTFPLDINPDDTAREIKRRIEKSEGIDSKRQKLSFNEAVLADGLPLAEYGIEGSSTIHLEVLRDAPASPLAAAAAAPAPAGAASSAPQQPAAASSSSETPRGDKAHWGDKPKLGKCFKWLTKALRDERVQEQLRNPSVARRLRAIIPRVVPMFLGNSPQLAGRLDSGHFCKRVLPELLREVVPAAPLLAAVLADEQVDAALGAVLPRVAATIRSFLEGMPETVARMKAELNAAPTSSSTGEPAADGFDLGEAIALLISAFRSAAVGGAGGRGRCGGGAAAPAAGEEGPMPFWHVLHRLMHLSSGAGNSNNNNNNEDDGDDKDDEPGAASSSDVPPHAGGCFRGGRGGFGGPWGACHRGGRGGGAAGFWPFGAGGWRHGHGHQHHQHAQQAQDDDATAGAPGGGWFHQNLVARFVRESPLAGVGANEVPASSDFVKRLEVRNDGSVAWPDGTRLMHVGGDVLGTGADVRVPSAAPGQTVAIDLPLRSPALPGRYIGYWRLAAGPRRFGQRFAVDVLVVTDAESRARPQPAQPQQQQQQQQQPFNPQMIGQLLQTFLQGMSQQQQHRQ